MTNKYSLREEFRRYLDSEELSGPIRSIGKLIASGAFSRASFDELMETEGLSGAPNLKGTLLDLTLAFTRKCVADHKLSAAEIDELETLVTIFRITEGDFYEFRREAVQEVISEQAMWMLGDQYVTEQEEVLQRDLQRLFGLSYDQYVLLLRPLATKHIEKLESKKLATRDPEELTLIDSSIRNLRGLFLVPRFGTRSSDRYDTAALVRYLKRTIAELVGPLGQVYSAHRKEGASNVDMNVLILDTLLVLGFYFAKVDGHHADDEASLSGEIFSKLPRRKRRGFQNLNT